MVVFVDSEDNMEQTVIFFTLIKNAAQISSFSSSKEMFSANFASFVLIEREHDYIRLRGNAQWYYSSQEVEPKQNNKSACCYCRSIIKASVPPSFGSVG